MSILIDEAIKVIQTEKACVLRNESKQCDRNCESCDLVLPINKVLFGYNVALIALKDMSNVLEDDCK